MGNNNLTKYYVALPGNRSRGTYEETVILGYTDNEFVFKHYVTETLPLLTNVEEFPEDTVYLVEQPAKDDKDLYCQIEQTYGISMGRNHEIEVYTSTNNEGFALYLTCEYVNESVLSNVDWVLDCVVYSFWQDIRYMDLVIGCLKLPNKARKFIEMIGKQYFVLLAILAIDDIIQDDTVKSNIKDHLLHLLRTKGISGNTLLYFGIMDILDEIMGWAYTLRMIN